MASSEGWQPNGTLSARKCLVINERHQMVSLGELGNCL